MHIYANIMHSYICWLQHMIAGMYIVQCTCQQSYGVPKVETMGVQDSKGMRRWFFSW